MPIDIQAILSLDRTAFLLLQVDPETVEDMFDPRHQAQWGQFVVKGDFLIEPVAAQEKARLEFQPPTAVSMAVEREPANASEILLHRDLRAFGEAHLGQKRCDRDPAIGDEPPLVFHAEGISARGDVLDEVFADIGNPAGCMAMLGLGVGDAASDVQLIIEMRRALAIKPCDLGFQSSFLHQPRIPRCDGLGERELIGSLADIVDGPDAAIAGKGSGHEALFALIVLPHRRVEGAERGVGEDFDLVVLIALSLNPAFPLLDVRGQPRHIEVMLGLQAPLDVGAGAHLFGRADQDTDAARVEVVEQALFIGAH